MFIKMGKDISFAIIGHRLIVIGRTSFKYVRKLQIYPCNKWSKEKLWQGAHKQIWC